MSKKPLRFDFLLLSIGYLTIFSYGLVDNVRGPIFPDLISDFRLSDFTGSYFFLVASTSAFAANLTAPIWMHHLKSLTAVRLFCVCEAVGLGLFALGKTYYVVLIGAVGVGLALGGLGILVNLLVNEAALPAWRRRSLSGLHACYGVASLIIPVVVTWFYHEGQRWPQVFAALILGPIAVIALSFFHGPSKVQEQIKESSLKTATVRPKALSRGEGWALGVALAAAVVAEVSLATRLALYARRDLGFSLEEANVLVAEFFAAYVVVRLLLALVHVPWRTDLILRLACLGTLLCAALGLMGFAPAFIGAGFCIGAFYPFAMSFVHERFGDHAPWVISWCQGLQSVGLISMHLSLGLLSDRFGLGRALWMGPIVLLYSLGYFQWFALKSSQNSRHLPG